MHDKDANTKFRQPAFPKEVPLRFVYKTREESPLLREADLPKETGKPKKGGATLGSAGPVLPPVVHLTHREEGRQAAPPQPPPAGAPPPQARQTVPAAVFIAGAARGHLLLRGDLDANPTRDSFRALARNAKAPPHVRQAAKLVADYLDNIDKGLGSLTGGLLDLDGAEALPAFEGSFELGSFDGEVAEHSSPQPRASASKSKTSGKDESVAGERGGKAASAAAAAAAASVAPGTVPAAQRRAVVRRLGADSEGAAVAGGGRNAGRALIPGRKMRIRYIDFLAGHLPSLGGAGYSAIYR